MPRDSVSGIKKKCLTRGLGLNWFSVLFILKFNQYTPEGSVQSYLTFCHFLKHPVDQHYQRIQSKQGFHILHYINMPLMSGFPQMPMNTKSPTQKSSQNSALGVLICSYSRTYNSQTCLYNWTISDGKWEEFIFLTSNVGGDYLIIQLISII